MQGSEKQIKWAEDIKAKFFAKLETLKANLEAGKQPGYFTRFNSVYFELLAEIENRANAEESAAWWINNSLGRSPEPMLAAAVRRRQAQS
ncbi:MAG TPA: hypothetical protein VNN73_17395 [Blastocatellia bacterium]|nr:hypothetical protein [Blastocatellia bacterium]